MKTVIAAAAVLASSACASQSPEDLRASRDAAIRALPSSPEACSTPAGSVRPPSAQEIPARFLREMRSGWTIVRYSVENGKPAELSIQASSPGGAIDQFALSHVRSNINPASPNVIGCFVTITLLLS